MQEYRITASAQDTVLDCLLRIRRTTDPTLAFRYSCGHGMCGSDAVSINGTPTLLCSAHVVDWLRPDTAASDGFRSTGADPAAGNGEGVIDLAALPGFPVRRDLIADIDIMLEQIKRVKPLLQADGVLATTKDGKVDVTEYLQHPDELQRYLLLSDCIACGVCEGSCPVYAGGEAFVGPAALIAASRFINDSRDTATQARLQEINTDDGITACQSVKACGRQCPRGINVGEEMWQLTTKVNAQVNAQ